MLQFEKWVILGAGSGNHTFQAASSIWGTGMVDVSKGSQLRVEAAVNRGRTT